MDDSRIRSVSRDSASDDAPVTNDATANDPGHPNPGHTADEIKRGAAEGGAIPDLRPFADQLMAIARQLRDSAIDDAPSSETKPARSSGESAAQDHHEESSRHQSAAPSKGNASLPEARHEVKSLAELARRTYSLRRQRGAVFGNDELFGEPAWDILLDLYIAHCDGKSVSVSSACIGSAAPPTTGLRWLGVLADNGLVVREHDPQDQRRVLVRLTARGIEAMDRYLEMAAAGITMHRTV